MKDEQYRFVFYAGGHTRKGVKLTPSMLDFLMLWGELEYEDITPWLSSQQYDKTRSITKQVHDCILALPLIYLIKENASGKELLDD